MVIPPRAFCVSFTVTLTQKARGGITIVATA